MSNIRSRIAQPIDETGQGMRQNMSNLFCQYLKHQAPGGLSQVINYD